MKEITEDYVSFETAKLLKEKGFDEPVMYHFTPDGAQRKFQQAFYKDDIAQPTLQMALKWLMEVKHYYIQVRLDSWSCRDHIVYFVIIQKTDSDFELMLQEGARPVFYATPEEAYEDAINYCLEDLI